MKNLLKVYCMNFVIVGLLYVLNLFTLKWDLEDVFLAFGVLYIVFLVWNLKQNVRTIVAESPLSGLGENTLGQDFNHVGTMNALYEQYDEHAKPEISRNLSPVVSIYKRSTPLIHISFAVLSIGIGISKYLVYFIE